MNRTPFLLLSCLAGTLVAAGTAAGDQLLLRASFETVDEGVSPATGFSSEVHLSGARLADGLSGKGISLDGKDDAALVVDPGGDAPHDALTVQAWALMRERPSARALVVGKTGSARGKWLYLLGVEKSGAPFAEVRLVAPSGASVVQLAGPEPLETKRFYHLALAYGSRRRRVALCVDGLPVDQVWVDPETAVEAEAGRIWIGWGPTSFEERDIAGLPGTIDEVTLSASDHSPFAVECIEGARMDPPEWRRIAVQGRLAFDRFLVRAQNLLKENILDAPRFVEWRFADRERWVANREAGQLEEALAHCDRVLTSLETRKDRAGSLAPHPSPHKAISLLPENTVYGERGRLSFRVQLEAPQRVSIEITGAPAETRSMTVLCAHERCRFLPVGPWRTEGDPRAWSGRMKLPSTRGKWKLCLIGDAPVVSLAIEGEAVFKTTPEKARSGAPASVFDLEGVVNWGEQNLSVTLAEPPGADAVPFTAVVVNTASLAFARTEGPPHVARTLVAGPRVTVLAVDAAGNADSAFVEVFGDLQPSPNGAVSCDAVALGFATQKATLLADCEFVAMLDATRAICGKRLRIPAAAFAWPAEDRGGVTLAEADALAQEAGVLVMISCRRRQDPLNIQEMELPIPSLGIGWPYTSLEVVEPAGEDGTRDFVEDVDRSAEHPLGRPRAKVNVLDDKVLFHRTGRRPDEPKTDDPPPPAFLSPFGLSRKLGIETRATYALDWAPARPTAQMYGMGMPHPETAVLEMILSSQNMSLKEIMFELGGFTPRSFPDGGPAALSRYVDRSAVRAACAVLPRMPTQAPSWSAGPALSLAGEGFDLLAAPPSGPPPAGNLDFWSSDLRRAGDPRVIVAAVRGKGKSRLVVASCRGLVTVRSVASEIHHCYGVNAFGMRSFDVPFLNLADEGIVFASPGDPAIAYFELAPAD